MTILTPPTPLAALLAGCDDPRVAWQRAADLVPVPGDGPDRDFWAQNSRMLLTVLLYAAGRANAIAEGNGTAARVTVDDVAAWVSRPNEHGSRIRNLLGDAPATWRAFFDGFLTTNDRTRTSITATAMLYLASADAPESGTPAPRRLPERIAAAWRELAR